MAGTCGPFYPLLSYRHNEVDPALNLSRDDGEERLKRLRPVLRLCTKTSGMEMFLDEVDPASLVAMLAPPARNPAAMDAWIKAERASVLDSLLSVQSNSKPSIRLTTPTLKVLSIEEADALDEVARMSCVPLRHESSLVQPNVPAQNPVPVVTISWPADAFKMAGGKQRCFLGINRVGEGRVQFYAAGCTGAHTKNVYGDGLPKLLLDRLFAPIESSIPTPQALYAAPVLRVPTSAGEVPEMMQLQLAAFAQNRLRAQVLVTAAGPETSSRPLAFENMRVSWLAPGPDSKIKTKRMQVKAYFHRSSAACFCGAHNLTIADRYPRERFSGKQTAVLIMEMCGLPVSEMGATSVPCRLHASKTKRSDFAPCVCCAATSVSFKCEHECERSIKGQCMKPSSYFPVPLGALEWKELTMLLGVVSRYDREARPLFEAKPVPPDARQQIAQLVEKHTREMDKLITGFDLWTVSQATRTTDADLIQMDVLAVEKLRNSVLIQGKLTGHQKAPRLVRLKGDATAEEKKLVKHHHWLFPHHDGHVGVKRPADPAAPTAPTAPADPAAPGEPSSSSAGAGAEKDPSGPSNTPKQPRVRDPSFDYSAITEYIDPAGLANAREQLAALMAKESISEHEHRRGLHFQQVLDAFDSECGPEIDGPLGLPARPLLCKYRARNDGGRIYPTEMPTVNDPQKSKQRTVCIQGAPREIRPFLCCRWGRDFDMANAQPEMLRQMANQLTWPDDRAPPEMPQLNNWCDDRKEFITWVADCHSLPTDDDVQQEDYRKDMIKTLMISLMFGGEYEHWIKKICTEFKRPFEHEPRCERVVQLEAELGKLRTAVFESRKWMPFVEKDRARLKREGKKDSPEAIDRSVFARIAQSVENDVLTVMRVFLRENGWTVLTLCFDGLIVQERPMRTLDLAAMEARITKDTGFRLKILEKPLFNAAEYPVLSLARAG